MPDATIKLGEWEILLTTTLLITEGQEARVLLTPDDPLFVRIRFETSLPKEGEPKKTTLSAFGEGNDGGLLFTNWDNPLGAATEQPLEFANDDQGHVIAALCSANRIGKSHQVFLQFMRRVQS